MRLRNSAAHLTYCSNIHPGETWPEVRANLERHLLAVKAEVAPDRPFGVGLRLSAVAAAALRAPAERAALRDFLRAHDLYVFTINAFPYGPFHGQPVKEAVYLPDWRAPERLRYTDDVADLLADLLPADLTGSISTVPGGFRPRAAGEGRAEMAHAIAQAGASLFRLAERTGRTLSLALEPEPACAFETSAEAAHFIEREIYAGPGRAAFTAATGLDGGAADQALRRHVGVCLDACHAAVEFEAPTEGVDLFAAAGIPVFKLQVSAGLRIVAPDAAKLAALARFAEGVYLHQVVIRRGTELVRVVDLPEALAAHAARPGDEWRVHFHVPLFRSALGPFENTNGFLATLLARAARQPFTAHLEVETYTWDVLPEELRNEPVARAVARELRWTLAALGESGQNEAAPPP